MALESITAGPWSLAPAIVAISIAWYSRDALMGLFLGIVSAGIIYGAFRPEVVGVPDGLTAGILGIILGGIFGLKTIPVLIVNSPFLSSTYYLKNVLIALFAIGGLMGLMIRSGAIRGLLETLTARADSAADAEKVSYLAGIIIHIDDYFNCLVVGSMMRPLTDKYDVSRAKLAYYVDSAGSPASRLAFYSTWGVALVGFIASGLVTAAKQGVLPASMSEYVIKTQDGIQPATDAIWPLFFKTIPFAFYSWAALILAALVAWQIFPNIFKMGEEENRARSGDGVLGPDATPLMADEIAEYEMYEGATPDWRNFLIPILTLFIIALGSLFWLGKPVVEAQQMNTLFSVFGYEFLVPAGGRWSFNIGGIGLGLASITALAVAFVLFRVRGDIPSNRDGSDAMVKGFKGIFLAAVILLFATGIQNSVATLGIATFVSDWFKGIPLALIPIIIFFVTSFISISDGSSWATYGIMFPIAVPTAFITGANLLLILGAVFSGGVLGDHCSPVSDTTVLSSSTSGSDHMVHVKTQIPYAAICGGVTAVLFLVLGFLYPTGF